MSMSVQTLVSETEYLETGYEPDCEFEDGVLIERNVGTIDHGRLQALLTAYFVNREKQWNVYAYTDVRMLVRAGKYLIPDIIVSATELTGKVIESPPLLTIEILSPDDRFFRVGERVRAQLAFGVPYVWVIDPETLESELFTQSGSQKIEDRVLRLPGTAIEVDLNRLKEE